MWNLTYSNRKCNELEKIRDHKQHLERLVTAKKVINIDEPSKPSFLIFKAKKEKMEQEKKMKIDYENGVISKKLIEIRTKPSPYNPNVLQVKDCPAYDKTYYMKTKKRKDLVDENIKFRNRLMSAQPHYRTDEVLKDYMNSRYLESMISNNKSNKNPSLFFETPDKFKNKLFSYIQSQQMSQENSTSGEHPVHKRNVVSAKVGGNRELSVSSGGKKTYDKKPLSGMTKTSTNTNYNNHNELNYNQFKEKEIESSQFKNYSTN